MATQGAIVDPEKLAVFASRALQKMGVPEEDALTTARILVATDLRGVESHGVAHLAPFYIKRIREGLINVKPEIKLFSNAPATAIMDGDRGLGFVVGHRAMTEAIRRAEATGAGFVTVRNSTHYGAGASYAMMALPHDMIGISLSTGGKDMAVPGGKGRGGPINVISIAIPAADEAPFVLDMATTVVAAGKVETALRKGIPIPAGWSVDSEWQPITDPKRYFEVKGAMLPLGGTPELGLYKGFGLAVAVDILSSILSGSLSSIEILGEPGSQGRCNHFFGALRVSGFMPIEEFKKGIDGLAKAYHALPKMAGVNRIFLAGEKEHEIGKERRDSGIPLDPVVTASLKELAKELHIEYNL
ncbi:MAG: Ldh family oxidoreductase [Chloroflexota bacterium]